MRRRAFIATGGVGLVGAALATPAIEQKEDDQRRKHQRRQVGD
jgi:hypothetical protein